LDVYSALHARPRWLDARSALTEALFEAEEAMEGAGRGVPWILKPSLTNKGAGIVIVHSMEEVEACVVEEQEVGQ
jgi:carbamoylphosphate synthase large subunit